jgi:hypothetical protein
LGFEPSEKISCIIDDFLFSPQAWNSNK